MKVIALEKNVWGTTLGTHHGNVQVGQDGTFELADEKALDLIENSPHFEDFEEYVSRGNASDFKAKKQLLKEKLGGIDKDAIKVVASVVLPKTVYEKNKTKNSKVLVALIIGSIKEEDIDDVISSIEETDKEE